MQQDFPRQGMICFPYLLEMHERVNSGEESTVEPSSSLRYKLRYSIYITSGQLSDYEWVTYLAHLSLQLHFSHTLRPTARLAWRQAPSKEYGPQQGTCLR